MFRFSIGSSFPRVGKGLVLSLRWNTGDPFVLIQEPLQSARAEAATVRGIGKDRFGIEASMRFQLRVGDRNCIRDGQHMLRLFVSSILCSTDAPRMMPVNNVIPAGQFRIIQRQDQVAHVSPQYGARGFARSFPRSLYARLAALARFKWRSDLTTFHTAHAAGADL